MNRKELLESLKDVDKNMVVVVYYMGLYLSTDRVESYRGSYDCISLSIDESKIKNGKTIGWLIEELENTDILYGYKGGEYYVDEDAHVYVSPYGYSSEQYVRRVEARTSENKCIIYAYD